jgi:hypothetical protein
VCQIYYLSAEEQSKQGLDTLSAIGNSQVTQSSAVTLRRKTEHVAGTENNTTHLIINSIKNSTVIPHIIIQIPEDLSDLTILLTSNFLID